MLECLILGDSLATGIGQVRTECATVAKNGINSVDYVNSHILRKHDNKPAKTVIISLGSNDTAKINTLRELDTLRQLVAADRVYWIVPNIKEDKRLAVFTVADKYKDFVIDARKHATGPDQIHPTHQGYKTISEKTK
jgi:lysophospholipase L1-like esterase